MFYAYGICSAVYGLLAHHSMDSLDKLSVRIHFWETFKLLTHNSFRVSKSLTDKYNTYNTYKT